MHIASPVVEKAFLSRLPYRCESASIAASCFLPSVEGKVNFCHFGLTKCTIYCKNIPVFVSIFLYAVTMLIFQIKGIVSSEKWFNCVVTFFVFWVGRTTLIKRRKKEDGLRRIV